MIKLDETLLKSNQVHFLQVAKNVLHFLRRFREESCDVFNRFDPVYQSKHVLVHVL